jgi:hypothetical protein
VEVSALSEVEACGVRTRVFCGDSTLRRILQTRRADNQELDPLESRSDGRFDGNLSVKRC